MGRLFKIPNDDQEDYSRFIGGHTSEKMDAMVILLSLVRKSSKAFLLRYIIDWYFKKQRLSLGKLVAAMVEKAYLKFAIDFKQPGERDESLKIFKKELTYDLKSRKIPDQYVEDIIEKFDERAKVEQTNEAENH